MTCATNVKVQGIQTIIMRSKANRDAYRGFRNLNSRNTSFARTFITLFCSQIVFASSVPNFRTKNQGYGSMFVLVHTFA